MAHLRFRPRLVLENATERAKVRPVDLRMAG